MTLSIRCAGLADLDALAPLFDQYRQFYGRASDLAATRAFLQARCENGESVLLLAANVAGPAGFVQLYPSFSSISLARIFILNDLFVIPAARRQGVAGRLLAAAAEHGRQAGAVRLALSTATDNYPAQTLYQAHGWQRDSEFLHYELALPG